MRKYLSVFLALGFVFYIVSLNVNSADAQSASSQLFPLTVKSVFGTDHIIKAFPLPAQYSGTPFKFAGRYFDGKERGGSNTSLGFEWYSMAATNLTGGTKIKTAGNKIYMILGNTVAAYNKDTFISRLANSANSSLSVFAGSKEPNKTPQESYDHGILPWDAYLYPEHRDNAWVFPHVDNHTGLTAFDVDDRSYIYFVDRFGFGIARDQGGSIRILTQVIDTSSSEVALPTFKSDTNGTIKITDMEGYGQPSQTYDDVYAVKAGGKYYAVITGAGSGGKSGTRVIDVTDPLNPQFIRSAPEEIITNLIQSGDNVAVTTGPFIGKIHGGSSDGQLRPEIQVYKASDFISGGIPKKVFSAGSISTNANESPGYIGLALDKASGKFYSMHYSSNPRYSSSAPAYVSPTASISVFSPASGGTYTEKRYPLSAASMGGQSSTGPAWAGYKYIYTVESLSSQNGYLVANGLPATSEQMITSDLKIWTFANGEPKELDTKGFIPSYYTGKIYKTAVHSIGSKSYLFISTYELADVYELTTASGTTTDTGCAAGNVYSTQTGKPCACVLNPTFPMGTKSQAVKDFQQKLKDLGLYTGNVDGTYGPITRGADLAYCISTKFPLPAPLSTPPVIGTISGPTSLGLNTLGTWTASATDANKDDLSWSVNFGEGKSVLTCKINPPVGTSQGWSYTASHSWSTAGSYTVTFYANDCKGGSASKSITVNVSGGGGGGSGGGGQNQSY